MNNSVYFTFILFCLIFEPPFLNIPSVLTLVMIKEHNSWTNLGTTNCWPVGMVTVCVGKICSGFLKDVPFFTS